MIIFFLFFMLFVLVETKYKTTHFIKTSFKSNKKLLNFVTSCDFFKKYLQTINAEKINFNPPIDNKKSINEEQTIEYTYKPVISNLPLLPLKKIKIEHNWKLYKTKFIGHIKTYYICFDMEIYTKESDNDLLLVFDAEINDKKFFIPNVALKYALIDFGNAFFEILNNS